MGGGSPMDAAKAVGVLASNPGRLLDYVGLGKVAHPLPILIAIPTTTGTGSEVTQFTVITDHAQRRKVVIGGPQVAPSHALLDPELVANLPAGLVGATAMDALTHAVESVISTFASPFTDGLALQAIRMIADNLPEPAAPAARANLLYASTMAGMAFSYAAHRIGARHGPPVERLLRRAARAGERHPAAARAWLQRAGLRTRAGARGGSPRPAADSVAAIAAIQQLGRAAGIPPNLSSVGVTEEFIPQMSNDAYQSGNAQLVNPRKPTLADVEMLYRQAL